MNFSDIVGDIFGDIFGGGHAGPQRGSDLRYNLEITLENAVFGTTVELTIPTLVACEECKGSGARKGASPVTCKDCDGYGQVRMQQGFFSVQQTCPTCRGKGKLILDPCGECRGKGRRKQNKKLSVKIPPGVDTGDRIRLSGEGEAGESGATPGDLYVQVSVKELLIISIGDTFLLDLNSKKLEEFNQIGYVSNVRTAQPLSRKEIQILRLILIAKLKSQLPTDLIKELFTFFW